MWCKLLLCIGACMSMSGLDFGFGSMLHTVHLISGQYQDEAAITVDIVVVYDAKLAEQLRGMKSAEYFSTVNSLYNAHPDDIYIWRFQQPTSYNRNLEGLQWPANQVTCSQMFIFVDYRNNKDNRITIPRSAKHVQLRLGRNEVESVTFDYARKDIRAHKKVNEPRPTIYLGARS